MDRGGSNVIGGFIILAILTATPILLSVFIWLFKKRGGGVSQLAMFIIGCLLVPLVWLSAWIGYELIKGAIAQSRYARLHPRDHTWIYTGETLTSWIETFYDQNPGEFTFVGQDEAAESPALLQYLSEKPDFASSGFRVAGTDLVSPFGDKVAIAIDRDRNGVLLVWFNHVLSSPWTDGQHRCALVRFAADKNAQQSFPDWRRLD
jgi:hypothetical protein